MTELSIIKLFLNYDVWKTYAGSLSVKDFPAELQPVFSTLDSYHAAHQENLTVDDLANLLYTNKTKDKEYYNGIVDTLRNLVCSDATVHSLIQSILDNKRLKEISLVAYDVTEGRKSKDDLLKLLSQFTETTQAPDAGEEFSFITDDLEELLNQSYQTPGLRWRLPTLNKMLGSLRAGDFGFIFARPETGKTTFLASETTFMAEQLSDDSGPILWLNNEEQGNKVKLRCYQASLGCSLTDFYANTAQCKLDFLERTKGKHKIYNPVGAIHRKTVEAMCKKYKPSLIIFDQIDKIVGFDADREDLKLGAMYQWARELAKTYQCPVIGVCQADGSGEGQKWLTMANVANAKTAKQAEADWIVGIGKIHDPGYENLRYLHASKNKLFGDTDSDPTLRHGKCEVLININHARYEDI